MGINRYGTGFCQGFQTQNVVDVVVGDENGLDVVQREVLLHQFFLDLSCADAHIDEQTLILPAHKVAIAAAARGKTAKNEGRKARKEVHPE